MSKLIPVTCGKSFDLSSVYGFPQRYFPLITEEEDVVGVFVLSNGTDGLVWVDVRLLWQMEHHCAPIAPRPDPDGSLFQMALNVALRPLGYIYYEIPQE